MKKALVLLALVVTNAMAFTDDPVAPFDASTLMTTKTTISWEVVPNANVRCQAESKKRGYGGFGSKVEACSFWEKGLTGNRCIIITNKWTSMHQLGHETRHCFQGGFHK
jgi:hypothetical protein